MPKYQLDTTAEVPSRAALRSFTGRSNSAVVSQGDDAGVFRCDESDLTSADDDLDTVVDYLGRRWKRLGIGSMSFQQSGTGAEIISAQEKMRELYTSRDFGALADDSTNDAAAVQAAQDAAGTKYTIDFGNGVYRVRPGATSFDYFGNLTSNLTYRAVEIDKSDLTLKGGRFHISSRASVAAGDVQPAFATDKHTTVGTLENITFDGVEIDTENAADATNSNQRGMYMTGVRGLHFVKTKGLSTGARRGYFAHIQNCENVQISGHSHRKVTGGFNFRYCNGILIENSTFDDFSEAIDFDGTSSNAVMNNVVFRGTARTSQCMDVNGQVGLKATNITVETVGNIATIQYKDTTPPNYSDYINNVSPSSLTPSKDVTIRGVRGSAIGSSVLASMIFGNDWAGVPHDGYDPVSNITIEDVQLSDTSYFYVFEGRNVVFRDVHLKDVITPLGFTSIYMGSFVNSDARLTWSDLTVRLENVSVEESDYGAVKIADARSVAIDGLKVRLSNQVSGSEPDLRVTAMESRGTDATIDGLDVSGGVIISGDSTAISAWAGTTAYAKNKLVTNGSKFYRCTTAGTSAGAGGPTTIADAITDGTVVWEYLEEPFRVTWGRNNKVRGTVLLQGDSNKYVHGRTLQLNLGDIAATGTVARVALVAKRRCYIARVTYAASAGVTADATNFRALTLNSIQNGGGALSVCQINTTANSWTAFTGVDGGSITAARALLNPGDTAYVNLTSASAGVAITGLVVSLEILDL